MSFYPDTPKKQHRIHRIQQLTGWEPKPFYWQDKTFCNYTDKGEGINRYCRDIRKSTVDKAFTKVFGYSSFADPGGTGKAVIKSEKNWSKDGRIVELPYELKEGEVCQRLIDTWNGEAFVEYRALIINGMVRGFMKKTKPNRFDSAGCKMEYLRGDGESLLLQIWRTYNIEKFAKQIGMDYGEIDLLCDGETPYLIDANKTPGGYKWVDRLGNDFINAHKPLFI